MEYKNPQLPEGINTSTEHPFREFLTLLVGVIVLVLVAGLVLAMAADRLAKYIPFEFEARFVEPMLADGKGADAAGAHVEINRYLNTLAAELSEHMEVPEGIHFTVHYGDTDDVNASAWIGGQIRLERGLLRRLKHENALSMVLAHEMAHVVERHPIRSLGRGLVIMAFLSTLTGVCTDWVGSNFVSSAGILPNLKFSRDQETEADRIALAAVDSYYGHINGAADLFRLFKDAEGGVLRTPLTVFRTHPMTDERLQMIENYHSEGAPAPVTPFPTGMARWLRQAR